MYDAMASLLEYEIDNIYSFLYSELQITVMAFQGNSRNPEDPMEAGKATAEETPGPSGARKRKSSKRTPPGEKPNPAKRVMYLLQLSRQAD